MRDRILNDAPNQKWESNVSGFWTPEGWLYLPIVMDMRPPGSSVGPRATE